MEPALSKLLAAISPPEDVRRRDVNWNEVERKLGFAFPSSFKEFVAVYGESQWFDLYSSTVYPDSVADIDEYKTLLQDFHKTVADHGIRDEGKLDGRPITLYPEPGGLLFFMSSSDGDYYFWLTTSSDPDHWPIVVWQLGSIFKLKENSIAELLQNTFEALRAQSHRLWANFPGTGIGRVDSRVK